MLQDFLTRNREILIDRCRLKVATRRAPRADEQELAFGIPLFLDQLIGALRLEQSSGLRRGRPERVRTAQRRGRRHGSELLRRGFTVGQVVHDYGDLLPGHHRRGRRAERGRSPGEFRTLNWCLDNAIADAVTGVRAPARRVRVGRLHLAANERLGALSHEFRNLVHRAMLAMATIKQGGVGLGATGASSSAA